MSVNKTISTTIEVVNKLEQYQISPSECFRVGAGVKIAEAECIEPETPQQMRNKIAALVEQLAKAHKKIYELEQKYEKKAGIEEPSSVESAPLKKVL